MLLELSDDDGSVATLMEYIVPAGKTIYVCGLFGHCFAHAAANRNNNQMVYSYVTIDATEVLTVGGNGGFSIAFPVPIKVVAGEDVGVGLQNIANHNCDLSATLLAYEVE